MQLRAVCDIDDAAAEVAEEFDAIAYTDTTELVADSSLDIVSIATHETAHTTPAIECLNHGIDVFCEKPSRTRSRPRDVWSMSPKRLNRSSVSIRTSDDG